MCVGAYVSECVYGCGSVGVEVGVYVFFVIKLGDGMVDVEGGGYAEVCVL